MNADLFAAIANAEIGRGNLNGRTIGGAVLKAVLFTVAAFEGQPFSMRAIADRCSCSHSSAACALGILRREGFIVPIRLGGSMLNAYRVSAARLHEVRTDSPLVNRTGRKNPYRKIARYVA